LPLRSESDADSAYGQALETVCARLAQGCNTILFKDFQEIMQQSGVVQAGAVQAGDVYVGDYANSRDLCDQFELRSVCVTSKDDQTLTFCVGEDLCDCIDDTRSAMGDASCDCIDDTKCAVGDSAIVGALYVGKDVVSKLETEVDVRDFGYDNLDEVPRVNVTTALGDTSIAGTLDVTGLFSSTNFWTDDDYNTASGAQVLSSNITGRFNTATGYQSLNQNTLGNDNVGVGSKALYDNTTGDRNTATGTSALENGSDNTDNTALGWKALYTNDTGDDNTAVGSGALYSNTIGVDNTATGSGALFSNTTSSFNVAVGSQALYSNQTYSGLTAVGYQALKNSTTGYYNTALGYQALIANVGGDYNTASGYRALYSNTEGDYNAASGYQALMANTTGSSNTASGFCALYRNTTGNYNVVMGYYALGSISGDNEGDYNIAIGRQALYRNTTGNENVAVGGLTLDSNTTGSNNTAIGDDSLGINSTGYFNTAVGSDSLDSNSTGRRNTAIGYMAGEKNTTGSYNIFIGDRAGSGLYSYKNRNICIGATASGHSNVDNRIFIGEQDSHEGCNIAGISDTNVTTDAVYINSSGRLGINTSSRRFKEDINDMPMSSVQDLTKLRPVTFAYIEDETKQKQYGLIAEEVIDVYPEIVNLDKDGLPRSVRYNQFVPILIEGYQKHDAEITGYGEKIAGHDSEIEVLKAQVKELQDQLAARD